MEIELVTQLNLEFNWVSMFEDEDIEYFIEYGMSLFTFK